VRLSFVLDGKLLQDLNTYVASREANKSLVIRNAIEAYLAAKEPKVGGQI
jgi:metal-responsive CopG/Arc/MetJ family transcriptional regulator